jgi:hypothetical protein
MENLPADLTTADEELGTNHRQGMEVTTTGPGTIYYDAGPLLRHWSAKKLWSAGVGLDIKNITRRG